MTHSMDGDIWWPFTKKNGVLYLLFVNHELMAIVKRVFLAGWDNF